MTEIHVFAWLLAAPPIVGLSIFSAEVLFGLWPLRASPPPTGQMRAAAIIPAHNEASSIEQAVANLSGGQLPLRVVVVADNCTDETASLAIAAGADCAIRNEPELRGKGFALAHGRAYLERDPPDVVLILDADCYMNPASVKLVISAAFAMQSPVQAKYILVGPTAPPSLVQLSNFAFLMKNLVRARGLYRIGGGVPLFGTGMALPWGLFRNAQLASSNIVEDLGLAVELAMSGVAVHFDERAEVLSASAAAEDTMAQRTRWEHGFMQVAWSQAMPLLWHGARRLSRLQVAFALHLCVPPLALLMLAAAICTAACLMTGLISDYWTPAAILVSALIVALSLTLAAWWRDGRNTLTAAALARAPLYVLRKLPMYLAFRTSRQAVWNRTRRDGEPH